jgi:hypothetical protein
MNEETKWGMYIPFLKRNSEACSHIDEPGEHYAK